MTGHQHFLDASVVHYEWNNAIPARLEIDDAGSHNTAPPRKNGGNMDIKQLTAGTTVFLPVCVDGALFSVGEAHGAQGDGEVCITAVEMNARITLKFELHLRGQARRHNTIGVREYKDNALRIYPTYPVSR